MPTIHNMASNSASVSFQYDGFTITVEYYPKKLSLKVLNEIQSTTNSDKFLEKLCLLIKSWNLFEDEAETIMTPLTPERLEELPIDLLAAITRAIGEDMRPETIAPQIQN